MTPEITEIEPGVFYTLLAPCSAAVLPQVLDAENSHAWLVEHLPDERILWGMLPVPLQPGGSAVPLPVRGLSYDLQLPTADFLARVVPQLTTQRGITLLQLSRPVPDSLRYRELWRLPRRYDILRQNGWQLTFDLHHGGDPGEVTAPERGTLERLLANPMIAAGNAAGELP